MTRPDLDAIRARCDAATPGPWKAVAYWHDGPMSDVMSPSGEPFCCVSFEKPDAALEDATAQFIAAARTDIPALLAYIDELERDLLNERATFESCNRARMHCEYECATLKARTTYTVGETDWAQRIAVAEQRFVDEYDARRDVERQRDELLRVNKGAAQHGIITEYVREMIELLGIQLQNPTANEAVDAAANEIKTLRTTVEELKARITTLEAMR